MLLPAPCCHAGKTSSAARRTLLPAARRTQQSRVGRFSFLQVSLHRNTREKKRAAAWFPASCRCHFGDASKQDRASVRAASLSSLASGGRNRNFACQPAAPASRASQIFPPSRAHDRTLPNVCLADRLVSTAHETTHAHHLLAASCCPPDAQPKLPLRRFLLPKRTPGPPNKQQARQKRKFFLFLFDREPEFA